MCVCAVAQRPERRTLPAWMSFCCAAAMSAERASMATLAAPTVVSAGTSSAIVLPLSVLTVSFMVVAGGRVWGGA